MDAGDERVNDVNGFWETLRVIFLERLSSPLISTFIISWCVTNYKVLLIVLGKAELSDKLTKLDTYFAGPMLVNIPSAWWIYGAPFLATLFYIFIYPHINLRVMEIVNKNDNKLKTQQELNKYKRVVDDLKARIIERDSAIAEQKKAIEEVEASLSNTRTDLEDQSVLNERLQLELVGLQNIKKSEQLIIDLLHPFFLNGRGVELDKLSEQAAKKGLKDPEFKKAMKSLLDQSLVNIVSTEEHTTVTRLPETDKTLAGLIKSKIKKNELKADTDRGSDMNALGIKADELGP